jgi:hypothetical protein
MGNPIRDYIYLDIDRVRSVYAQAAGGLVQSIVKSEQVSDKEFTTEHGPLLAKSEVGKELLWGTGQVETRVLHDYLFTEMENLLGEVISTVTEETLNAVKPGDIVRITGNAELDDMGRLLKFAENFTDLYRYIGVMPFANLIEEKKKELEKQLATANTNERKRIQKQINSLSPEEVLKNIHIGVSPILVQGLEMILNLLYENVFELKIIYPSDEEAVFRGILNRDYLRENSTLIYAKYGSRTQVEWTMVGQITTIYEPEEVGKEDEQLTGEVAQDVSRLIDTHIEIDTSSRESHNDETINQMETSSNTKSIRDAIEGIFNSLYGFEELLMISRERKTWVITPLAVYHEITLPSVENT